MDNWVLSVNMIVLAALTLGFILWHFAHAALIHVSTPLKYSPMMSHKFFDSVAQLIIAWSVARICYLWEYYYLYVVAGCKKREAYRCLRH